MLLLPHDEEVTFDRNELKAFLSAAGVSTVRDVNDEFIDFKWSFKNGDEQASASLQAGGAAINLDPENRAAATLAFDLSRKFKFPVDLINDEYTYQLDLSSFTSSDELWNAVTFAYQRATDGPEPYRV